MEQNQQRLTELLQRIDEIASRQSQLQQELELLRNHAQELIHQDEKPVVDETHATVTSPSESNYAPDFILSEKEKIHEHQNFVFEELPKEIVVEASSQSSTTPPIPPKQKAPTPAKNSNLEKFIGENLINKVGIGITILGVAFGAKYAIDHGLLSPALRVLLGYLLGGALLFVATKLRSKYEGYSAVLTGGSMAIFYLMTYASYSHFHFFNQGVAFFLMVVVTGVTIFYALSYNSQVLAQIGMVAAYAVPFLVSDNSGRVVVLFTYIALINIGILFIASRKSWKFLFYSAFVITWLIYGGWLGFSMRSNQFEIAMLFLVVHFLVFQITFLSPALVHGQKSKVLDLIVIGINMWLLYLLGRSIISGQEEHVALNRAFVLLNLLIPSVCYWAVNYTKVDDRPLRLILFSFASFFLFISIQVFFDDQWTTIVLAIAGLGYFILGRLYKWFFFEGFSYIFMPIVVLSLLVDWGISNSYYAARPEYRGGPLFFNMTLLASVFVIGFFFFAKRIREQRSEDSFAQDSGLEKFLNAFIPFTLLLLVYASLRVEISGIWVEKFQFIQTQYRTLNLTEIPGKQFFRRNETLWVIIYSLSFLSILSVLNMWKWKSRFLGIVLLVASTLCLLTFMTQGLMALRYLREDVVETSYNHAMVGVKMLRYISIVMLATLIGITWRHVRQSYFHKSLATVFDCLMHTIIIWLATSELLIVLKNYNSAQMYKLGLTILWGTYALFLIIGGIWKRMKHLRIMGMIIFAFTIAKLLLYDLDNLSTIAKAGLFILIGLFLLLVSYLYLRFKKKIFGED